MHPQALARRLRAGDSVSVLDVRDRDEYETWHVEGRNVTDAQVPHAKFIAANARGDPAELVSDELDERIVVVCPQGKASAEVAEMLRESGVDAVNLAGGMNAWARTYLAVELDAGDASVVQYQRSSSGCLAYLIVSDGEAAVLDPLRAFAERYEDDVAQRGVELLYAIDTHVHADHVSGLRAIGNRAADRAAGEVADESPVEVVLPAGAEDRGLAFDATLVDDGEEVRVGDVALEAIHAPGHTSELTAFRLRSRDDPDVLFTADALFLRSVGRPDLESGDDAAREYADRAYDTLHDRLLALPDDTLVAPGHFADHADARAGTGASAADASGRGGDEESTDGNLSHEAYAAPLADLRTLDVLELDREAFVERVATDLPPRPSNYERIVATNLGREEMDDEDAFEAELGPNNCAVSAD
nr:MBL fold metallo-hydrolase [Halobaculum halophilum]